MKTADAAEIFADNPTAHLVTRCHPEEMKHRYGATVRQNRGHFSCGKTPSLAPSDERVGSAADWRRDCFGFAGDREIIEGFFSLWPFCP